MECRTQGKPRWWEGKRGRERERVRNMEERRDIALGNLIQVAFLLYAYVLNVGHA